MALADDTAQSDEATLNHDTIVEVPVRVFALRGTEVEVMVSPSRLPELLADPNAVVWVDLRGTCAETENVLRDTFAFHPLTIQDCFEAQAHPKIEGFENYVFFTVHGLLRGSTPFEADTVELDVFLGRRFVVTFHERESRSVEAVAQLIERGGGPLRRGPIALLHAILDRQIDGMEPVLEGVEEAIETLESRVWERPARSDLALLSQLKRTTLQFRRWMTKQREVLLRLSRNEFSLIPPQDALLFRDVYDHLARFTDLVESHRDMIASLQETYLNATSLRLGEIMKFLTLFTAILMPLTVWTGIYGMNFEHMPELRASWGYPAVLGAMLMTALGVFSYFKRKGWVGDDGASAKLPRPSLLPSSLRRRSQHHRVVSNPPGK